MFSTYYYFFFIIFSTFKCIFSIDHHYDITAKYYLLFLTNPEISRRRTATRRPASTSPTTQCKPA